MSRPEHQLDCEPDFNSNVRFAPIEVIKNIKQMTREEFNKELKAHNEYAHVSENISFLTDLSHTSDSKYCPESATPNEYIETEERFIKDTWSKWQNPQEIFSFFEEMHSKLWDACVKHWYGNHHSFRAQFVREYGWSLISPSAILQMAEFIGADECLSIGCGSAYIEYLLRMAGAKIAVTDNNSEKCQKRYLEPFICEGSQASKHFPTCKVLFMSWSRIDAAKYGEFDKIIYLGEGENGCTAGYPDRSKWVRIRTINIPVWYGLNDFIGLFVRKYPRRPKRSVCKDITSNFSFVLNACETKTNSESNEKRSSAMIINQNTYRRDFPPLRGFCFT